MPGETGLVIVDYHSWSDTRAALEAAQAVTEPFARIVVVDTGGETPEDEAAALGAELIRAPRNGGFAYGVNLGLAGLAEAGLRFAMLLNPDARLDPETPATLRRAVEADAAIAIAGPLVWAGPERRRLEFAGARAQWHIGRLPHRTRLRPRTPAVSDQPFITGCCWLLRMDAYRALGPLPEGYFLYFEDTDYCLTAQRAGWRTVLVRGAEVVHLGSTTIGRHSPLYRYQFARNRIWFMRRWARWDQMAAFLVFTALVKTPLALVLFGLRDRDWPALKGYLCGTLDGLLSPGPKGRAA